MQSGQLGDLTLNLIKTRELTQRRGNIDNFLRRRVGSVVNFTHLRMLSTIGAKFFSR